MLVGYWQSRKRQTEEKTNIVESTTGMPSLHDLNRRVHAVRNTCSSSGNVQGIPAEGSQSGLQELGREGDVEIPSRRVVSESQVNSGVGFVVTCLELQDTAGQWPWCSRGRWSISATTGSSSLGLLIVATRGRELELEMCVRGCGQ